jgi:hypothetical protein
LQKKDVEGVASIDKYSVLLNVLNDGADYQGILPRLWHKVRVVAAVETNGDLGPSKVLGGGRFDHHDLLGCEFLLPLKLLQVGAIEDVADLFVSFGEVTLGILGLLLLISRLGRLENLIYKTLESVVVSSLVLSLGVKNANAIQEAFEFTRPRPILLMAMRSLQCIDGIVRFSLLVMAFR